MGGACTPTCGSNGATCTEGTQCCSGNCSNGTCACKTYSSACNNNSECCSGYCNQFGICDQNVVECACQDGFIYPNLCTMAACGDTTAQHRSVIPSVYRWNAEAGSWSNAFWAAAGISGERVLTAVCISSEPARE